MAANKIYIQVDFQSQTAQGAITALNQNIASIGPAAQQATAQAAQGAKGLSVSVEQVTGSVTSLAQALAGLGLAQMGREMIGIGADLQRMRVGFENIAGGTQAWDELHTLAAAVGADFKEMVKNADDLGDAGVSIKKVVDVIRTFHDQALFSVTSQEELNAAIAAFAKIAASGYVSVKQLVEFRVLGLQPTKEIADKLNMSIQELRASSKQLNADAVADLILGMMRTQSQGESLRRSNELLSAGFNKVKLAFLDASEALVRSFEPEIKEVIRLLIELLKTIKAVFEFFGQFKSKNLFDLSVFGLEVFGVTKLLKALPPAFAAAGVEAGTAMGLGISSSLSLVLEGTLIVLAAKFGWEFGKLIRESLFHDQAEINAMVQQTRKETLDQITMLEQRVAKARKVPFAEVVMAGEANLPQEQLEERRNALLAEAQRLKESTKKLLEPDYAEIKRQAELGASILAAAQQKFYLAGHEAIRALDYEYAEHFKKVEKSVQGTADVWIAANYAIATAIKKRNEEMNKENDKVLQEIISMGRKIAVASETLFPDATFAARKRAQESIAQDNEQAIRDQFRLREELATKESSKLVTEAEQSKLFKTQELRIKAIQKLQADVVVAVGNLETLKDQTIYENKLKNLTAIHNLEEEQRQQDRDRALEDQLDFLQKSASLRIQYVQAETAQTLPERLRQIQTVRDLEIQAIQETQQARLAAVAAEVADYKSKHVIGVAEIEKTAAQQAVMINRDAQAQMQSDRLNAWREGNDAVIEEQRRVYDSLRSAFDRIWSALTDRSKSVWANIGNALRTALTDAVKSFVTSRVAASVTEAFTGRGVTFPGGIRGLGGSAPKFEGLGAPPAVEALAAPLGVSAQAQFVSAQAQLAAANAMVTMAGVVGAGIGGGAAAGTALAAVNSAGAAVSSAGATISSAGGMLPGMILPTAAQGGVLLPGMMPSMRGSLGLGGGVGRLGGLLGTFGIGQPVATGGTISQLPGIILPPGGVAATVPWSAATMAQKLGAIVKSPGFSALAATLGASLAMGGLQRGGLAGNVQTIGGGALAGMAIGNMVPWLGPLGGGLAGAGIGTAAAGLQRGGVSGLAMSVGGGALAGLMLGGPIGAAIGAVVGGIAGLIRLGISTFDDQLRSAIKRVYGIDVKERSIRDQIAGIIKSKYGGSISVGIYSQDIQEVLRLYSLSQGLAGAGLPRQMLPATFAQSQTGGLQMQPVYSGGQLVANPYTGTTSTQLQNALTTSSPLFIQLNPQQAYNLFSGQVVKVIGDNPGAVAGANTTAAQTGTSRTSQVSALMEPLAVLR